MRIKGKNLAKNNNWKWRERIKENWKEEERLQLGGLGRVCLEWWAGEPMWANRERRRFGRNSMPAAEAAMMMMMMTLLPPFLSPSYDLSFFLSFLYYYYYSLSLSLWFLMITITINVPYQIKGVRFLTFSF